MYKVIIDIVEIIRRTVIKIIAVRDISIIIKNNLRTCTHFVI